MYGYRKGEKFQKVSRDSNHGIVCSVAVIKFIPFCALIYLTQTNSSAPYGVGVVDRFNFGCRIF